MLRKAGLKLNSNDKNFFIIILKNMVLDQDLLFTHLFNFPLKLTS